MALNLWQWGKRVLRGLTKTTCCFRSVTALGTVLLVIGLGFCLFHIDEHGPHGHGMPQTFCGGLSMGPIGAAPIFSLGVSGSLEVIWTYNANTVDRMPLDHPPESSLAA